MAFRIKVFSRDTVPTEAQLLGGAERFMLLAERHRVGIIVGVVLAIVALGVVGLAIWYQYQQAEKASVLKREAALFYFDRPADDPLKASERLKQAISKYRELVQEYPRTPSAQLALYHLGNALVQFNDIGGAIEAYKKYIASYGSNKPMLGLVYQRLGYAYLASGDPEEAVKAFQGIVAVPGSLNKDHALLELGKLEETRSNPEGAMSYYQNLVKDYPNSAYAGEASVRIKALEAKTGPRDDKENESSDADEADSTRD
ncbi:MAG: tetratricopeptide repeat protein [Nitrospiraceae bacterium]